MIGSMDPEYSVSQELVRQAQFEMFMYAGGLAAKRREHPRDDLVTTLLNADIDGDKLSEMDFNPLFLVLAVARKETTRNALSHGMNTLIDHPAQYQMLRDNPALVPSATEEILRWASPVMYFRRNLMRDTELRGQRIMAGDKITIWYISANRDEEVFDDPFRFDITRSPNEHVAFGGGPHVCLGQHLARIEIDAILIEVLTRMPNLEILNPPEWLASTFISGPKSMPVRYSPGKPM